MIQYNTVILVQNATFESYVINYGSNEGIAQPQIGPVKDHGPTF